MSNYVQIFYQMLDIWIFFYSNGITGFIFGFLCLIKPDSERISTLEPYISLKRGVLYSIIMSAILDR